MLIHVLLSIGLIVVGALMFVSGIKSNRRCTRKTVGRITGVHESESTDDAGYKFYSYSPEYEYEVNGQIYHGCGGRSYKKRRHIQIGGSIDVFYNPDKPQEHYNKGSKNNLPMCGIGLITFGFIYMFYIFLAFVEM